ncbi:GNAT family N-acetyltransferase [Candidatus Woesearchaeota archaeon]|nr:GNAT family N-acetyltransferase [Candidatus Woesearchaeota archaeon]
MTYKIELIKSVDDFDRFSDDWIKLNRSIKNRYIFQDFFWIKNIVKHITNYEQLLIILVFENKELVGVGHFAVFNENNERILKFLGTPLSDYNEFIIAKDDKNIIKIILKTLFRNKKYFDKIILNQVPVNSKTYKNLKKIFDSEKMKHIIAEDLGCPVFNYKKISEQKAKIKLNKKDVRRHMNHLKKKGVLKFEKAENIRQARKFMKVMINQHLDRWNKENDPSMFNEKMYIVFFNEILDNYWEKDAIRFSCLKLNDEYLALLFSFIFNKRVQAYTTTYNNDYYKYYPGLILFKKDVENFVGKNISVFDLGRGTERYKLRFSTEVIKTAKIFIFKNNFKYLKHNLVIYLKQTGRKILAFFNHIHDVIFLYKKDRFKRLFKNK